MEDIERDYKIDKYGRSSDVMIMWEMLLMLMCSMLMQIGMCKQLKMRVVFINSGTVIEDFWSPGYLVVDKLIYEIEILLLQCMGIDYLCLCNMWRNVEIEPGRMSLCLFMNFCYRRKYRISGDWLTTDPDYNNRNNRQIGGKEARQAKRTCKAYLGDNL